LHPARSPTTIAGPSTARAPAISQGILCFKNDDSDCIASLLFTSGEERTQPPRTDGARSGRFSECHNQDWLRISCAFAASSGKTTSCGPFGTLATEAVYASQSTPLAFSMPRCQPGL